MSEQYKSEPIFGDQSLFDGAPEDAEYAGWFCQETRWYMILNGKILFSDGGTWCTSDNPYLSADVAAMRRIIKVPTWTKADQLAGLLPKIGCLAEHVKSHYKVEILAIRNGYLVVLLCGSETQEPVVLSIEAFLQYYQPIETSAEKAQRLESEWVEKAYDDLLAHVGIHSTESTDFVKQNLHRIYNAMRSGEIKAPEVE